MALHMHCTRHCIVAELPSLPIATPTLSLSYAQPYAQGRDLPPPAQILPMDLATAPSPKNKAIQLKELPSHRAIARFLHGPAGPLKVVWSGRSSIPWPPGAGSSRTQAALLRPRDQPHRPESRTGPKGTQRRVRP